MTSYFEQGTPATTLNIDSAIDFDVQPRRPGVRRKPAVASRREGGIWLRLGRIGLWSLVGFNLFILLFLLVSSTKTTQQIFADPWAPPTSLDLSNWTAAWSQGNFGRAAINTVILVSAGAATVVALSAPAAFALARVPGRIASGITVYFVLGIGVPSQVIVIPLFVIMSKVDLTNSLFGLYIAYTGISLPFTVFLLTGFFRSLPSDLEDAASVDGASIVRTFLQIMLPLARSGLITALILNVIGMWNETLIVLIFIQSTAKNTLSLALLNFYSALQYNGNNYGELFAGVCIVILPVLVAYVWLGRRIIEGITFGAAR